VAALEPNITPDPGNGPSNTVQASATFLHCDSEGSLAAVTASGEPSGCDE
jgi:hypothetical protein